MAVPLLTNKFFPAFGDWMAGAWSGTHFYIFANYGGDVLVSPTGIEGDWTLSNIGAALSLSLWLNGVAASGDECVAVSNGGDGYCLATADGGATWFNGTMNPTKAWNAIATDGAGFWVAVSDGMSGNVCATSPDVGLSWTGRPSLSNAHAWFAVHWTGTKFIAGAVDGYISTSADGITWGGLVQLTAAATIRNIFQDQVSGRIYINCGAGTPEIYYSDNDGASWTLVNPPFESLDDGAGLYKDGILIIRNSSPNTAYTTDIAVVAFDVGDNPLDFDPSNLIYGVAASVPTAIAFGRFTDEYIYGTGFQPSGVVLDDCFFHFTF